MAKVFGAASALRVYTIFLIIYNFNYYCAATEYQKNEVYNINSNLSQLGSYVSIVKLREKRDTSDIFNEYSSVRQNPTVNSKQIPPISSQSGIQQTNAQVPDHPSIVTSSSNLSDRPLLGVNGTGQRLDITNKKQTNQSVTLDSTGTATSTSSTALLGGAAGEGTATATNDANTTKKTKSFPKKATVGGVLVGTSLPVVNSTADDKLNIDNIDVPENETISTFTHQNYTNQTDYHLYYNSTTVINKEDANRIWLEIKNISHNTMLSQAHRRAVTVELTFDFPFYGHLVRNVTVATGGFLYTGEYVHTLLAATQYIAPLMANFDTSLGNNSFVRLNDNGTALTVIWENVSLQDKEDVGKFTFSATLHKSGDIVFAYFNVPISIVGIQDDKHPVKVGLSDAYIIDKVVYFARRKTIYEYHRVNFANSNITNSTIIYFTALPTCLGYNDCASCLTHQTSFECSWCPSLNRCSTGTDRKKQEWISKGCERSAITNNTYCPAIGTKGNNSSQPNDSANNSNNSNNRSNNDNRSDSLLPVHSNESSDNTAYDTKYQKKETKAAFNNHVEPKSMGLAVGFLVPISLVVAALLWVFYAYRNPHTKSGQILIQYRPSQWSWRRGEARYTAATIHM